MTDLLYYGWREWEYKPTVIREDETDDEWVGMSDLIYLLLPACLYRLFKFN